MHPAAPPPAHTGRSVLVPEAPALIAGLREVLWVSADGEVAHLPAAAALKRARAAPPLLCHARATARRLAADPFPAFDVLELFAFVRPAAFCTPTPRGLAAALGLAHPNDPVAAARILYEATTALLGELAAADRKRDPAAADIAAAMANGGWLWGPFVRAAVEVPPEGTRPRRGLAVWDRLPGWSEQAPPPPPGQAPVGTAEARARLAHMLGSEAEARPQQADYASAASQAFDPRQAPGEPNLVLAEAGTGVGKTLGYLAPASLWAEKNGGAVWISTYTRNLQHQIDGELDRLYPTLKDKAEHVVVRKGRENYLCLLNLEEAVNGLTTRPGDAVAVGLMARWTGRSRDGDMVGGDFPGWLADLAGRGRTLGLTDRRGECIYSACAHYGKCFIERGIRRARHAHIVVANHALVMIQAALGSGDDGQLPTRYVFDEGHHLFAAADNAFAAHLSGQEGQALRRWLLGAEGTGGTGARSGGGRARGLRRRVEDLLNGAERLEAPMAAALMAARVLPGDGWHQRLAGGQPHGICEQFLAAVRRQVYARAETTDNAYSLEAPSHPPSPEMIAAGTELAQAFARIVEPLAQFRARLATRLDDGAADLDSDTRRRIEAICRSLERRALLPLAAWQRMLATLAEDTPPEYVDWLAVERSDGRDLDVGLYRHWVDPTVPFAATVLASAHGAVITSATLTDGSGDAEADWAAAELRTGTRHLPNPAIRAQVPSPFDYAVQTRAIVVTDLGRGNMAQIAAAYRELFLAAGGGALGLFTAISRLRAVHGHIGGTLEDAGLNLYAQHVDGMDVSTLVDIFRAEEDSCLLGTDAVRDGVDVPGRALRLIVFDRVPWPRPDLAHKARRAAFGARTYDDTLTRLRLRQAFGRLVRRADDRGVFVLLDSRLPSRLATAFPEGVTVQRLGLAQAIATTRAFLSQAEGGEEQR
ncbi:MAG TPA: ATP-dependent DNA helicase [Kiloniellales bacterium]|jgi:ATP-dependent DNA helicase DinG